MGIFEVSKFIFYISWAIILKISGWLTCDYLEEIVELGLQKILIQNVISSEPFEIAHSNFGSICILVTENKSQSLK